MNLEQAQKLQALHDAGYMIWIRDTGYVDSPVANIYESDDGELVYDSEVFCGRTLRQVPVDMVEVYQTMNDWPNSDWHATK